MLRALQWWIRAAEGGVLEGRVTDSLSRELLMGLLRATPEQLAAIERILGVGGAAARGERRMAGSRFVFRRVGSHWDVMFDGGPVFHLEDTLGAKYLDYLLHHPNEPISAFDLEVAVVPEKGQARDKGSIQNGVDGEAVRKYLRELEKLRADRDEASDQGDQAEVDRIDEGIGATEAELRKTGRSMDTGERARGNVSKAIMAVRRKLLKRGGLEKAFGEHIGEKVSLGYKLNYNSPRGGIWQ